MSTEPRADPLVVLLIDDAVDDAPDDAELIATHLESAAGPPGVTPMGLVHSRRSGAGAADGGATLVHVGS